MKDFYYTGRDGKGALIKQFTCGSCGHEVTKVCDHGENCENPDEATYEVTLGFYGPNGNGYNYWCRKCGSRMSFKSTYSALDNFFGFNQ